MDKLDAELAKVVQYGSALPTPKNESETCEWVILPVLWALGYERHEITSRAWDGKGYPDYTLLADSPTTWYLEAKAWGVELSPSHVTQALNYAHANGKRWVVLSNGRVWELYDDHIRGVSEDRLVARSSIDDVGDLRELLRALCKASMAQGATESFATSRRLAEFLGRQLFDPQSPAVKSLTNIARAQLGQPVAPASIIAFLRSLGHNQDRHNDPVSPQIPEQSVPVAMSNAVDGSLQPMNLLTPISDMHGQKAEEIAMRLLDAGWWVFRSGTTGLHVLKPGDRICVYRAGRGVIADMVVDSVPEIGVLPEVSDPEVFKWRFRVKDIRRYFDYPVKVTAELRMRLDAFRDKDPRSGCWSWFVQGTGKVSAHDFGVLTGRITNP